MNLTSTRIELLNSGVDCRKEFKIAYENRYTWPNVFEGYKGLVQFNNGSTTETGEFVIDSKFKGQVEGIKSEDIKKAILTQLWEVTIHRVRRKFDDIHSENIFTTGNVNEFGTEILFSELIFF